MTNISITPTNSKQVDDSTAVITLQMMDAWQRAVLADRELSVSTKLVACCVALYVNRKSGNCFPSAITIAADIRMSRHTVMRAISALKAHRYLDVQERRGQSSILSPIVGEPTCRSSATGCKAATGDAVRLHGASKPATCSRTATGPVAKFCNTPCRTGATHNLLLNPTKNPSSSSDLRSATTEKIFGKSSEMIITGGQNNLDRPDQLEEDIPF